MREVVIVEARRTAVGRLGGSLANYRSDDLLAEVLADLVEAAGISKHLVDDVIIGSVTQLGEQAMNIARDALLIAGFPYTVPGVTIDRQCGSSQQAVHFGAQAILAGDMDVVIAGGVESMTRSPMFSNLADVKPSPRLREKYEIVNQGISAEKIAEKWRLTREELDQFSLKSHLAALKAIQSGHYDAEIVPLEIEGEIFAQDEGPRPDTSLEALSKLKPVFKEKGLITAGNASQMSDGASALLLMSKERAIELGLKPRAKIITRVVTGSDPTLMLTGPIEATKQALEKSGLSIEDIDRYEVNEAFAPVPLVWLKELDADIDRLNVNGGAIALGHPLGATGTKLLTSLLHELERSQSRYGLLAICEGMGMANATIIERVTD